MTTIAAADLEAFFARAARPRIHELAAHACRWPVGQDEDGAHTFCGSDVARLGKSYCTDHARLAYIAEGKRARSASAPRPDRRDRARAEPLNRRMLDLARHMAASEAYDPARRR